MCPTAVHLGSDERVGISSGLCSYRLVVFGKGLRERGLSHCYAVPFFSSQPNLDQRPTPLTMEAQQRHSPEPIIEEPFHHHIDQSASDILHDLTPEQTDLLKIQLQIATSSRLHLQPFSLEDDEAPSQLEHHIHPEDSGRSGEDLTPTGRLHHLGFGDPTGFEDDPALQIHHHHQPIYEDPTGGPYPFNLSPTSLSFDHPDLTQLHHHHPEQHTLPIQPVASSSTSSLDDTLKPGTAPIKKKLGRPSRKLRMEKGAEEECNGNGKGTSSGPTKRLRTVASLGDDTEKIEKLRAQGRERQRRKRERDRARAAGLVVEVSLCPFSWGKGSNG